MSYYGEYNIDKKETPLVYGENSYVTPNKNNHVTVPNSAVNPNGDLAGNNLDEINITNQNNPNDNSTNKGKSAKEIAQRIIMNCNKNGIDYYKIHKGLSKLTGLHGKKDLESLSPEQRAVMMKFVERSIDFAIKHKRPNVDVEEMVLMNAFVTYEIVIKNRTFKDAASFENEINNNASDFINNISNIKSEEEFDAMISNFEKEMKSKFENDLNSIKNDKNLTEEEKQNKINELKEKHAAIRKGIVARLLSEDTTDENHINSLSIAESKDLPELNDYLYKLQPNDERRKIIGIKSDFNVDKKRLKIYKERGEKVDTEAFSEYVKTNVSWKDADSAKTYHQQVMEAAANSDTAEFSFMTEELFEAITKGIGVGAEINHVMSVEEKAEFISQWDSDIKSYYTDKNMPEKYESIKSEVSKQVSEYSKNQPISTSKRNEFTTDIASKPPIKQKYSFKQSPYIDSKVITKSDTQLNPKYTIEHKELLAKIKNNPTKVTEALILDDIGIEEAIEALGSKQDFVIMCVKNPMLAAIHDQYIKNYILSEEDDKNKTEIARFASLDIKLFVVHNSKDKEKVINDLKEYGIGHDALAILKKEMEKDDNTKGHNIQDSATTREAS